MKRILWAGMVLVVVMTFVFGVSLAESSGGESTWTMTVDGDVLLLSGSGAIPGLEDPATVEWAGSLDVIQRIVIGDGITSIGKNVLSGFTYPELRIDFKMNDMPEIDPEAFVGTTAVCRYYSDNSGWTGGSFGGNLTWIYLPEDIQNSDVNTLVYYSETGWSVQIPGQFGARFLSVTAAQADEILWKSRAVALHGLPETEADWAVVENFKATYFVSFQEECAGTKTLTIGDESRTNIGMDLYAPDLVLEVNTAEGKLSTISVGGGQVTVNGDVYSIVASGFATSHEGNHPSLTVNGNVQKLHFYDATSDREYTGDLTINGTLEQGTEYGSGTLSIPHISDSVEISSINTATFSNIQQQDPIILNGRLNVEDVQPLEDLTVDMFSLRYSFLGKDYLGRNDWRLSLSPRQEYSNLGEYGADINSIADYNPDFTVDDIIWGEHTSVDFWRLHEAETIVLNGQVDANGNLLGLESCSARDVNVVINCPVQRLSIEQYPADWDAPVNCTINERVDWCWINFCGNGNHVSLGENGKILEVFPF